MEENELRKAVQRSIDAKVQLTDDEILRPLHKLIHAVIDCFKNKKRVYWCGNGGSAADAQHLAAELSGKYKMDRPALPSESFTTNTSFITAVANDYGYDKVFARAVEAHCSEGDVLIGLTTSGTSANVLNALERARDGGVITAAVTGKNGLGLQRLVRHHLVIPTEDTAHIQEATLMLGHVLCEEVERALFQSRS